MKAPQVLALDQTGVEYVETLLTNHLQNPDFCYSLSINKSTYPLFSNAKQIQPYQHVKQMFMDTETIFCIDVTLRSGKSKGGTRIVLADPDAEVDFNPLELPGFPKYSTSGQQQRELEIVERARMGWENEALKRENTTLKESVDNLKEQLKKAEEFSNEVEKLLTDLRSKSQDKGTLEQITDFIGKVAAYAPGLLKDTPLQGFTKAAETIPALGETTATPKTEAQPVAQNIPQYDEETIALCEMLRKLKPYFSAYEFQDCFKLLGLLARHKPLIPELYELALEEVKRQLAIRQQAAERKQQQEKAKQPAPPQEQATTTHPPQDQQTDHAQDEPETEEEDYNDDETGPPAT